jgi:nucleoid DNA-binding protein
MPGTDHHFRLGKLTVGKAPRTGPDPRTGEQIMISAHRVVNFEASLVLEAEVNPN